jgi:hypothetical protein
MNITHRIKYAFGHVDADTNSIASDCDAMTFDNYGSQDVNIYSNDIGHIHGTDYIILKPGKSITLGNNPSAILLDIYDIVFSGSGLKGCNLMKETYQILS